MLEVALSIRGEVHLLFFPVFVGYIFKGTGGASVQWIGSRLPLGLRPLRFKFGNFFPIMK